MISKPKYITCTVFAWLSAIGVPTAVTLSYFPLFVAQSSTMTVAGGTVVVLMLCAVPFLKQLKAWFPHTPASWVVWLAIAGLLLLVRSIIDQMLVVAIWGSASNVLAGILFKVATHYKGVNDNE